MSPNSAHNFTVYGVQRPAETADSTALVRRSMVRMRPVQLRAARTALKCLGVRPTREKQSSRSASALRAISSTSAGLGLTMEEVHTIFRRAQAERSACTPLDPITLPGVVFWGRVIRFAREVYIPKGWKPKRPKLIELVVNPQETFAFTVCSGNQNTGKHGPEYDAPTSRYGKGTAMKERIAANQLVFPGMEAPPPQRDADAYAGETWCLLYYHEAVRDENEPTEKTRLWSELSLPENVGDRGKIDTWKERIILDPIDFDEPLALLDPDEENPPDIDVPIERLT